jgi:hypothetical protein
MWSFLRRNWNSMPSMTTLSPSMRSARRSPHEHIMTPSSPRTAYVSPASVPIVNPTFLPVGYPAGRRSRICPSAVFRGTVHLVTGFELESSCLSGDRYLLTDRPGLTSATSKELRGRERGGPWTGN